MRSPKSFKPCWQKENDILIKAERAVKNSLCFVLYKSPQMVEVIHREFYHLHSLKEDNQRTNRHSDKWVNGNVLYFGNKNADNTNILHDRVFNPYINLDWEKNFIRKLSQRRILSNSIQENKEIQSSFVENSLLSKYTQLAREIVFEDVRQTLFPEKPSRLNAIWLTDSDNITKWLKILSKYELPLKLFLVKFTGKIHKADGRWITNKLSPLSFDSYHLNAVGYWKGDLQTVSGKPDEEFLGDGSLEIIKEEVLFQTKRCSSQRV